MTTEEHLNRIKVRCQELLALAEKRTHGKWQHRKGGFCSYWISRADNFSKIAEIPAESCYTAPEISQNAIFIASCAGPAEAGWRATIAAIDEWSNLYKNTKHLRLTAKMALDHIIAAWPEELLS